jgi:hypothetical protein
VPYQKLRGKEPDEYRDLFIKTYCEEPIVTFDGISVKFYSSMFDHAFYESENKKKKDKSLFSYNRAEKILWIKETLEDSSAILKVGWDKKTKSFDNSRRVAIVKKDYVVIIRIYRENKARFVTAFEAYNSIENILSSPDWI